MISCTCVECGKTEKFSSMAAAASASYWIIGIAIEHNDYYALCPKCDYIGVGHKGKPNKEEPSPQTQFKNKDIVSFD